MLLIEKENKYLVIKIIYQVSKYMNITYFLQGLEEKSSDEKLKILYRKIMIDKNLLNETVYVERNQSLYINIYI